MTWNRSAAGGGVGNLERLTKDDDILPAVLFILDKSKDREGSKMLGDGSGRCGGDI